MKGGLAAQLAHAVESSFAAQAAEHGAAIHARAVEIRGRDPLATFLMDTFRRQVRKFGERALACQVAGDRAAALEQAGAGWRAAVNLRRVESAVEGVDAPEE
jgi:hypothetical protein